MVIKPKLQKASTNQRIPPLPVHSRPQQKPWCAWQRLAIQRKPVLVVKVSTLAGKHHIGSHKMGPHNQQRQSKCWHCLAEQQAMAVQPAGTQH
jgi:hypothetical protein